MRRSRLAGFLLVLLITTWRPSTAFACSCVAGPETCHEASTGDAVFEATVASIDVDKPTIPDGSYAFGPRTVHLRDVRAWKGEAVEVLMTGAGGGDCGYDFRVGTRYVIVGYRKADGRMWTGICSKTRPLDQARGLWQYIQSLSSSPQGGRVWGQVVPPGPDIETDGFGNYSRRPLVAARVSVDGPVRRTETVDADGRYSFAELPAGEYTLSVTLPTDRRDLKTVPSRTVLLNQPYACDELNFEIWREP